MAEVHWTNYVGMLTGVIGSILGYIGFKRSQDFKKLDLRIELNKNVNSASFDINKASGLIEEARISKDRLSAAAGFNRSGYMKNWNSELVKDVDSLSSLSQKIPKSTINFRDVQPNELERLLVQVHGIREEVSDVIVKYKNELEKDSDEVQEIKRSRR